jgi:hypothetical protein
LGGPGYPLPDVEVNQVALLLKVEVSAAGGQASLAPLAVRRGLTLHRSGRVLSARSSESGGAAGVLALANEASKRTEVEVAFAFGFDDGLEFQAREGTVEFQGGGWSATRTAAWSDIPAEQLAEVRSLDTYVWERFPISLMARRLGLEERPVETRFFAHSGARWPDDLPDVRHRRQVRVSHLLIERLRAAARENGVSFGTEVARRLAATPMPPPDFEAVEHGGQPLEISIFLSDALLAQLTALAVEEDCALGRLVQRRLAASLRA